MVGMVGNSQPIRTLANTIQGYTPPQMTAFTNPQVMDYAKGVGQSAQQNLQTQISDLNKALVMGDKGVEIGDKIALTRLLDQIPGLMGAVAYHGTPHTIRGKFDINKVGTGEGAQAYGHGIYFAENPAVANEYARELGSKIDVNGKPLYQANKTIGSTGNTELDDYLVANIGDVKATRRQLLSDIKEIRPTNPEAAKEMQKTLADLRKANVAVQDTGNLYKVDIPDADIPMMMDLDKPLSQQPKVMGALRSEAEQRVKDRTLVNIENDIRNSLPPIDIGNDYMAMFSDANVKAGQEIKKQALEKLNKMDLSSLVNKELESMKPLAMNWNMTGKEYYEFLSKNQGSPAKASEMLQRQGITGNRYLDEVSRNRGQGTSNFVVFDPSNVKILEKNSKPYDPLEEFLKSSGN